MPRSETPRVTRFLTLQQLLAGAEGAALFRYLLDGDDDFRARRLAALRRLTSPDAGGKLKEPVAVPELTIADGYEAWAPSYDSMPNALIRAEEPLVADALAGVPPGRALDAACGTGRHARRLAAAGHQTLGVDVSEPMLAIARTKAPLATFEVADLEALPVDDAAFDVAVCALALTHLAEPTTAITEISRAVREGGRVVIADAHPTFVLLQGQALFPTATGLAFVRNHAHLHSTYLRAFRRAGLTVVACEEKPMEAQFGDGLLAQAAEAAEALWANIPAILVWTLDKTGSASG